mgnify:CR=1 FL=1
MSEMALEMLPVEEPALEPLPADRFADRELSWLAFNERVLERIRIDRERQHRCLVAFVRFAQRGPFGHVRLWR